MVILNVENIMLLRAAIMKINERKLKHISIFKHFLIHYNFSMQGNIKYVFKYCLISVLAVTVMLELTWYILDRNIISIFITPWEGHTSA